MTAMTAMIASRSPSRAAELDSRPRTILRTGWRRSGILAGALAAALAFTSLVPAFPADDGGSAMPPSVREWSRSVWNAAKASDQKKVDELLASPPTDVEGKVLAHLRELFAARVEHSKNASKSIEDEIARKRTELRRSLDAGDLTRAMVAAANLKFLCREWVCELENKDVAEALARAEKEASAAEAAGDLLLAQEMYYRLRGLYESTTEGKLYRQWDAKLDQVSRRIGLLASYAPRQLGELRKVALARQRASALASAKDAEAEAKKDGRELDAVTKAALKSLDEEEQAAIVAPTGEEWREEVRGIAEPMLYESLRKLASEHVSNTGWRPLLLGSIDSMEILGSTEALSETFPRLADATARQKWLDAVRAQRERLKALGRDEVGRTFYKSIIAELLKVNADSIQLPEDVLLKEFGEGATHVLARDQEDPYSEIYWPDRIRRFKQSVDGKLVGVGIQIRHDEKREIMVAMPLEGSPAMRAGVKADDRIVAVDGESTIGWSLNRAVDKITGKVGDKVQLTVRREDKEGGKAEIPFDLERQVIKLFSVHGWWKESRDADGNPIWNWYIDPAMGIGYVRLTSFNEESFEDFGRAIAQMRSERPLRGLILDLRNNPGGLLTSAVDFVNLFVDRGEIVSCQDRLGQKVPRMTKNAQQNKATLTDVPLVVLINEGSASASEIVSGSLAAHGAAVVVGQRTFGKGSVQEVAPVGVSERGAPSGSPASEAVVKYTTHYYVLPGEGGAGPGRLVHKKPGASDWGVNPNIDVRMSPEQIEKSTTLRTEADMVGEGNTVPADKPRPDVNELLTKGLDPQLEAALLILEARVLQDLKQSPVAQNATK